MLSRMHGTQAFGMPPLQHQHGSRQSVMVPPFAPPAAFTPSSTSALFLSDGSSDDNEETTTPEIVTDETKVSTNATVVKIVNADTADDSSETTEPMQEAGSSTPIMDSNGDDDSNSDILTNNLSFLQSLGAITGRGEFASETQKQAAASVTQAIETAGALTSSDDNIGQTDVGTWELVYSSTQLFRSSPFFMAGRAVCKTDVEAARYDWFCDMHRAALAISQIAAVRHIISPTRLTSEFEVRAGAVPFVGASKLFRYSGGAPLVATGAIVSTADLEREGKDWRVYMDTVEIKGSNLPGLRQALDASGAQLQSRRLADVLEQTVSSYTTPKPLFRTTYLDEKYRVCRDQDDKLFFYVKTSDNTAPTDYSSVDSDLGIGRLLEGFNDAVSRFYI